MLFFKKIDEVFIQLHFYLLLVYQQNNYCACGFNIFIGFLLFFQATGNQKHFQAVPSTRKRGLWGGE